MRQTTLGRAIACALSTMLSWSLSGADARADEPSPALAKVVVAAQAEGQLNVIWGPALGAGDGAEAIQDAVNKTYGVSIKLNYTPGPSMPQMATRTIQEVKAGQTASSDLYIGVEVALTQMMAADVLNTVPWEEHFTYVTSAMAGDGRALLVATLFNGILYNAHAIPRNEVPHKIADIFRPEWKGKIASTPYAVGFDRLALLNGFDNVKAIVEKTAEWSGGLVRCGENERIASGEFIMLFLNCGDRIDDSMLPENGGPLGSGEIDDALATSLHYFGIPKTSAHPSAAILFAGFVASQAGQAIIDKYAHETSHLIPGTSAYKKAQSFVRRGLHLIALGPQDLLAHEKELDQYKTAFQKILLKQ
jgi:ABC-type Fe3+ transport system substrate-binding protein